MTGSIREGACTRASAPTPSRDSGYRVSAGGLGSRLGPRVRPSRGPYARPTRYYGYDCADCGHPRRRISRKTFRVYDRRPGSLNGRVKSVIIRAPVIPAIRSRPWRSPSRRPVVPIPEITFGRRNRRFHTFVFAFYEWSCTRAAQILIRLHGVCGYILIFFFFNRVVVVRVKLEKSAAPLVLSAFRRAANRRKWIVSLLSGTRDKSEIAFFLTILFCFIFFSVRVERYTIDSRHTLCRVRTYTRHNVTRRTLKSIKNRDEFLTRVARSGRTLKTNDSYRSWKTIRAFARIQPERETCPGVSGVFFFLFYISRKSRFCRSGFAFKLYAFWSFYSCGYNFSAPGIVGLTAVSSNGVIKPDSKRGVGITAVLSGWLLLLLSR